LNADVLKNKNKLCDMYIAIKKSSDKSRKKTLKDYGTGDVPIYR